jgi:hypothetical protein
MFHIASTHRAHLSVFTLQTMHQNLLTHTPSRAITETAALFGHATQTLSGVLVVVALILLHHHCTAISSMHSLRLLTGICLTVTVLANRSKKWHAKVVFHYLEGM